LSGGCCDMVGMVRPAAVNPHLPRTVILNHEVRDRGRNSVLSENRSPAARQACNQCDGLECSHGQCKSTSVTQSQVTNWLLFYRRGTLVMSTRCPSPEHTRCRSGVAIVAQCIFGWCVALRFLVTRRCGIRWDGNTHT
jgi:hypothetical protein